MSRASIDNPLKPSADSLQAAQMWRGAIPLPPGQPEVMVRITPPSGHSYVIRGVRRAAELVGVNPCSINQGVAARGFNSRAHR